MDRSKAYEILNGLLINPELGTEGSFVTSGPSSPLGSIALQAGDVYVQNTGTVPIIWQCVGPTTSDWRQLSAEDIAALDADALPSDIQTVLDSLLGGDTPAVSQTIIFGDSGNSTSGSYLSNQGVPSNVVGVTTGLANASIRSVFLGNENTRTGDVLIQERFPAGTGTYTTIYTLSLVAESFKQVTGLNVAVTQNSEIAVQVQTSLKNCKVVININGDSA